ncbi:uncharacterized protein CXQ87_003568 [Candidozyma duobushaemuli]|uniref:Uncharacterized protein n=2 Tax=Candidozyma TaxID=3303203 RepID=A0ABX8I6K4_9ASCO|nr:uncharacterized protein CXQ87_003568 [[Candida] duobushaemulonis]PVH15722.1 hypothetical protein CXQ87_003568 [[Candida] duobushaemulonis]QWU88905.1 hypothetical protein CA3LBN_003213 [[Candida] haemuloni]
MEGSSSAEGSSKQRRMHRRRPRKSPKEGEEKQSRRGKSKKASTPETPEQDYRFLEIVKLVKKYIPITINGLAVEKIVSLQLENQENVPKKAKAEIVINHVLRLIKRDASQPLYLSFMIPPADPDFPFELDTLKFNLTIPPNYPKDTKELPSIIVLNSDIPRGFSINIERGFKEIATVARSKKKIESDITLVDGRGLLSQIQTLNKYLEDFLKQEKRQTMKFVSFKPTENASPAQATRETTPVVVPPTPPPEPPAPHISSETNRLRIKYIDEMCTKLAHHVKLFHKSAKEIRYKVIVPVAGKKVPWLWNFQNNHADIFLSIPIEYPDITPTLSIPTNFSTNLLVAKKVGLDKTDKSLVEITQEAKAFEKNFKVNAESWIKSQESLPLVDIVNFVSNNIEVLGLPPQEYQRIVQLMEEVKAT